LNKNKNIIYLEQESIAEDCVILEHREEKMDILNEIDKLDKKYKDVIVLKYFDDLTIKEISQILEIPIGTAKTYLNRGLSSLRVSIGKENF
jgi:RNA polymerase sigma-70 factor (ECF subfamily)